MTLQIYMTNFIFAMKQGIEKENLRNQHKLNNTTRKKKTIGQDLNFRSNIISQQFIVQNV